MSPLRYVYILVSVLCVFLVVSKLVWRRGGGKSSLQASGAATDTKEETGVREPSGVVSTEDLSDNKLPSGYQGFYTPMSPGFGRDLRFVRGIPYSKSAILFDSFDAYVGRVGFRMGDSGHYIYCGKPFSENDSAIVIRIANIEKKGMFASDSSSLPATKTTFITGVVFYAVYDIREFKDSKLVDYLLWRVCEKVCRSFGLSLWSENWGPYEPYLAFTNTNSDHLWGSLYDTGWLHPLTLPTQKTDPAPTASEHEESETVEE